MEDKRWELLEEPREEHREKYDVTYCQYCGRVKRGDRRGYFNPIKLISEKYRNYIARRLPPGYEAKSVKVFKTGEEKDGYRLYEVIISIDGPKKHRLVRHFRYRENLGVCPRCFLKNSGYYEALVQIRGPKEKVEKAFERIRDKVETMDSFIRFEKNRDGIDVYFLDHPPARWMAKELVRRYGAKHILTRSLIKIEDGKRKAIETHSVRIPEFNEGDLVEMDNKRYIFLGVRNGRFELMRLPDMKVVSYPHKHEVKLLSRPVKGVVLDSDDYVAMVYVNDRMVYAEVPKRLEPGEEVEVYEIEDKHIAVPSLKRKLGKDRTVMKDFPLPDPEKGEAIMEILQPLGAGRFLARGKVKVDDREEDVVAKVFVPGKMKRRRSARVNTGDYVLVSLRYEESDKERRGEIRHKYSRDQVKKLMKEGLITEEEEDFEF